MIHVQRRDGSFDAHPGAEAGSPVATALALGALECAGLRAGQPAFDAAAGFLKTLGGYEVAIDAFAARGEVSALYLAAVGQLDPHFLPKLPLSIALAPGLERMLAGRLHAGNLMAFFTLLALGDRLRGGPTRPSGLFGTLMRGAIRELERVRAADYLASWQNPDGSWNQSLFATQLMTLGLSAMGIDRRDDRMQRATAWLDRQKRIEHGRLSLQAIPNDVWSTAMAMIGLLGSGADRNDPRVQLAVRFLLDAQLFDLQPRANQRRRGARRTGAWAFQRGNPTMPDCDDTGLVLTALGAYAGERSGRDVFRSIDDGVGWLRDMQNPDGGWAAYVWNLPGKAPGPMFLQDVPLPPLDDPRTAFSMFLEPPAELGDPATEGVTARVLWGFGACGVGRDDIAVCRAIDFMRQQQCDNGAFWDRWMTCYLPGTATALLGIAAVGERRSEPYVQRAIAWMKSRQNDDGGFGETYRAFRDPSEAGNGPSMPAVTGFVASALIAMGEGDSDEARRSIDYLLRTQDESGTWPNLGWVNPYVPPDTFYEYELPARSIPLMALGRYARYQAAKG